MMMKHQLYWCVNIRNRFNLDQVKRKNKNNGPLYDAIMESLLVYLLLNMFVVLAITFIVNIAKRTIYVGKTIKESYGEFPFSYIFSIYLNFKYL